MMHVLRAAFVIARRDFSAVILSKAFIIFLLGPLFPVMIGAMAAAVGSQVAEEGGRPIVGMVMSDVDSSHMERARDRLAQDLGDSAMPDLRRYPIRSDPAALMADRAERLSGVVSGSLAAPELTANESDTEQLRGKIALMAGLASAGPSAPRVDVVAHIVKQSPTSLHDEQVATGQAGQLLLCFLTMLLAGMVLSNMVEEKTNKIIEILAAAVPVDAIFVGKLMAMLAMSLVGIAVWGSCGLAAHLLLGMGNQVLAAPAIGWPLFVLLGVLYFSMAYILLGALFIGVGAQAGSVREVQTLSMPITMAQLVIFFFASYTVNKMGEPVEIAAAAFPFSSPFAMVARAAQSPDIWPHILALVWQSIWVALIIRIGVRLFRRNVLKSGGAGKVKPSGLFRRRKGEAAS